MPSLWDKLPDEVKQNIRDLKPDCDYQLSKWEILVGDRMKLEGIFQHVHDLFLKSQRWPDYMICADLVYVGEDLWQFQEPRRRRR
jgi:hypothetical protein